MTFDEAFDAVIGHEGGYVNNPTDPGKETNWGISKRSYPHLDIKGLTREAAKIIYLEDFWERIHAEELPKELVFHVFDFAVNSGIETAVRHLQRAVGVADDGHWGPVSRVAVAATSKSDTIMLLTASRLEFMTGLINWPNASRGWARRIAQNLRYGAQET